MGKIIIAKQIIRRGEIILAILRRHGSQRRGQDGIT